MLKRIVLVLMIAIQFAAVAPRANAEMEIPPCYPCGGK